VLGMGKGKVRYRTSSLPKNRSGSGEVISAGTFLNADEKHRQAKML
jgi:hypothetical protein